MAKVPRGGTNVQLNAITATVFDANEAETGSHSDATAELSTSSMARLARSTRPSMSIRPAQPMAHATTAGHEPARVVLRMRKASV